MNGLRPQTLAKRITRAFVEKRKMERLRGDEDHRGLPEGWREITLVAYTNGKQVVVPEQQGLEILNDDDEHNCDEQGCSSVSHVVARFPCPLEEDD